MVFWCHESWWNRWPVKVETLALSSLLFEFRIGLSWCTSHPDNLDEQQATGCWMKWWGSNLCGVNPTPRVKCGFILGEIQSKRHNFIPLSTRCYLRGGWVLSFLTKDSFFSELPLAHSDPFHWCPFLHIFYPALTARSPKNGHQNQMASSLEAWNIHG